MEELILGNTGIGKCLIVEVFLANTEKQFLYL